MDTNTSVDHVEVKDVVRLKAKINYINAKDEVRMVATKKATSPVTSGKGITFSKKLHELFISLGTSELLEFLKRTDVYKNEAKWEQKGRMLRGRCRSPLHHGPDNNPSMLINLEKGYAKCYTCGYYESHLGKILSPIIGLDAAGSIQKLQAQLNVSVFKEKDLRDTNTAEYYKHVELRNMISRVVNHFFCLATEDYLKYIDNEEGFADSPYFYTSQTLKYLYQRDPLLLKYGANLPLGLLPTKVDFVTLAQGMGITALDINDMLTCLGNKFTVTYNGAMVFSYHNDVNNVSAFRLRLPDTPDGKKQIVFIQDKYSESLGIFGLGHNSHVADVKAQKDVHAILVEGEFDAMAIMTYQLEAADFQCIPLCHGGSTSAGDISAITKTPITKVHLMPDNDHGGIANAKEVLSDASGMSIDVFQWPHEFSTPDIKDISDVFRRLHPPTVAECIYDYKQQYLSREAWARKRVKDECKDLNHEDTAEASEMRNIVQSYSKCLGIPSSAVTGTADLNQWVQASLKDLGLTEDLMDSFTERLSVEITADSSPEQSFMLSLQQALTKEFSFFAVDTSLNDIGKILAWDIRKNCMVKVDTSNSRGIGWNIITLLIGDVVPWVHSRCGLPSFVCAKVMNNSQGKLSPDAITENIVTDYIIKVFARMRKGLRNINTFAHKGSGVHWLPTQAGTSSLFVINGTLMFKGDFSEEGVLSWEALKSPVYEDYYLDTTLKPWTPLIKSVDDLNNPPTVPLSTILNRNMEFMNLGWDFKSQESESALMGMWATLLTVAKIFSGNFQFLAANERNSGKTALYMKAIGGSKGGEDSESIHITEHTIFMEGPTPAGFKQEVKTSSRTVVIDEFDNQSGNRKLEDQQEAILTILRSASTGTSIGYKGTPSGESRKEEFSASTMLAGIDPKLNSASKSRVITTDLKSGNDFRESPEAILLRKYTSAGIAELRGWNTLAMFQYIPAILKAHAEIEDAVRETPALFESETIGRFQKPVMKLLSVYKAAGIGGDLGWLKMGRAIIASKKDHLDSLDSTTTNQLLISDMLNTNFIEVADTLGVGKTHASLISLLESPNIVGDTSSINGANVGVYLHSQDYGSGDDVVTKYYLMFQWATLKQNSRLWKVFTAYNLSEASKIKSVASRHAKVLSDHKVDELLRESSGVLVPMSMVMPQARGTISVLDVSDTINFITSRATAIVQHSVSTDFLNTLPNVGS